MSSRSEKQGILDEIVWPRPVVKWVCAVLRERFGVPLLLHCDSRSWRLSLEGSEHEIRIETSKDTFAPDGPRLPCTYWNPEKEGWTSILERPLPAPGIASFSTPIIENNDRGFVIRYDILGLLYWMLTRQEEIGRADLDEHRRFTAKASHAFQQGYLERPIVDEWLDLLKQVIHRTWPDIKLRRHLYSQKVSHDVDRPSLYGFQPWHIVLRGMAGDLLKRHDPSGVLRLWVRSKSHRRLQRIDKFNTFDWLMDKAESHGLVSAFYFICDRRGTPYDCDYLLEYPAIRKLMRHIHSRGHEIGLHPSYNSYLDPDQIQREANHLRSICKKEGIYQNAFGGRMHYLQWQQPTTLLAWEEAGMAYDSTMTYADHVGFRCGTCFEYPAFDPLEKKQLSIRIRPLIVMEASLFGPTYMGLGVTKIALEKVLQLKQICQIVNGTFTMLWHNSSVATHQERAFYEEVLNG